MASPKICIGSGARPVTLRGLAAGERVRGLEARRHRGAGARHDLVMLDVQQSQPRLLTQREPDHAPELHELGLAEMGTETLPERVVRLAGPRDRLGIRERRLLPFAEALRALEVQQLVVLALDESLAATALRALVAAVLALDAARHVDA